MRKSLLFLLLFIGVNTYKTQAQVPSYIPTTGLIGYWPLDGTALNVASSLHNGIMNNVTNSNDRFGQPASALYLNGTTSFITLPASAMQQVSGAFTVTIWARSDTFVPSPTGHEIINDRSTSGWPYRFRVGYAYANNTTFNVDSAYFDRIASNGMIQKVGSLQPSFDGWEHYAFVYNFPTSTTASIMAYRNGQLIGSTPAPSAVSGGRNINIGRTFYPGSPANGLGFFKGSVDEACLWNRALTASEIQTLFNHCSIAIQSQPNNQTTTAGSNASFQVVAPTVSTFQWQIDSTGNGNWLTLTNGGQFSGVNTNSLNLAAVQRHQSGWQFRCSMSASNCNGFSETALLQVNCQQIINQGPVSTNQTVGGNASFQITGSLTTGQFQWQTNVGNGFVSLQNFGQYSGVNTPTLQVSNLSFNNSNQTFRCIASVSGCADTSTVANLIVTCQPLITQQPLDNTVGLQQTVTFTVSTTALGATYQWFQNSGMGFTALTNAGQYAGVQTAQLTITNTQLANNNLAFRCIITDTGCSDTSNTALLTVLNNVSVEHLNKSNIKLYPNPAKDQLTLVMEAGWQEQLVQVVDLLGRVRFDAMLAEGKHHLLIADWPAGTYFLRVGLQSTRFVVLP